MTQPSKRDDFLKRLQGSLSEGRFVKISLAHYTGGEADLKKISVKKVKIKNESMLSFVYTYKTRDITKNYTLEEGLSRIESYLREGFLAATLFTTENDFVFDGQKNSLRKNPPTHTETPDESHDRKKPRAIEAGKAYLHALRITDEKGNVHKNATDKYRQINRYIEILEPHLKTLAKKEKIIAADMGSGKGYLTFALYDHLMGNIGTQAHITGVEYRQDMVDLCNGIARDSGFENLSFVQGTIEDYRPAKLDLLIALHACDTATDDAIHRGIALNADVIVVAPCCHKQIRREMESVKSSNELESLTRHGIFMERQAEMVTDSLRALMLEYKGYAVKVFEFISSEHTAKNVLIIAEKSPKTKKDDPAVLEKIRNLKNYFGIKTHYLEKKLAL